MLYGEIYEGNCYAKPPLQLYPQSEGGAFNVIDCGANIGMFSRFICDRLPAARVWAFEPLPITLGVLRENTEKLGEAVTLLNYGLTAPGKCGMTKFSYFPDVPGCATSEPEDYWMLNAQFRVSPENVQELVDHVRTSSPALYWISVLFYPVRVPVLNLVFKLMFGQQNNSTVHYDCQLRTLSEAIDEEGIECIDLLKVDNEGAELDTLRGISDKHWRLVRQAVVEVNDVQEQDGTSRLKAMAALFEHHGFEVTTHRDGIFEIVKHPTYMVYAVRKSSS